MEGIRKRWKAKVPRESLNVVDSPLILMLLMLIIADLLAKIANLMERALGRFDPTLTFCIEMLYVLAYCFFVGSFIYLESAVTGNPPPWPLTETLNLGFVDEYASEVQTYIASIVVLGVIIYTLA